MRHQKYDINNDESVNKVRIRFDNWCSDRVNSRVACRPPTDTTETPGCRLCARKSFFRRSTYPSLVRALKHTVSVSLTGSQDGTTLQA